MQCSKHPPGALRAVATRTRKAAAASIQDIQDTMAASSRQMAHGRRLRTLARPGGSSRRRNTAPGAVREERRRRGPSSCATWPCPAAPVWTAVSACVPWRPGDLYSARSASEVARLQDSHATDSASTVFRSGDQKGNDGGSTTQPQHPEVGLSQRRRYNTGDDTASTKAVLFFSSFRSSVDNVKGVRGTRSPIPRTDRARGVLTVRTTTLERRKQPQTVSHAICHPESPEGTPSGTHFDERNSRHVESWRHDCRGHVHNPSATGAKD